MCYLGPLAVDMSAVKQFKKLCFTIGFRNKETTVNVCLEAETDKLEDVATVLHIDARHARTSLLLPACFTLSHQVHWLWACRTQMSPVSLIAPVSGELAQWRHGIATSGCIGGLRRDRFDFPWNVDLKNSKWTFEKHPLPIFFLVVALIPFCRKWKQLKKSRHSRHWKVQWQTCFTSGSTPLHTVYTTPPTCYWSTGWTGTLNSGWSCTRSMCFSSKLGCEGNQP